LKFGPVHSFGPLVPIEKQCEFFVGWGHGKSAFGGGRAVADGGVQPSTGVSPVPLGGTG
jgi:hypothetical protein